MILLRLVGLALITPVFCQELCSESSSDLDCGGRANRGPQPGSPAGVVVAATPLWIQES